MIQNERMLWYVRTSYKMQDLRSTRTGREDGATRKNSKKSTSNPGWNPIMHYNIRMKWYTQNILIKNTCFLIAYDQTRFFFGIWNSFDGVTLSISDSFLFPASDFSTSYASLESTGTSSFRTFSFSTFCIRS